MEIQCKTRDSSTNDVFDIYPNRGTPYLLSSRAGMKKHAYFLVLVLFSFLVFEIFFVLVLFLFAKSNKMFAKSNEKNSVFDLEIFSVLVLFLFSIFKVFRVLVLFLFENKNMFANMFPNNMRVLSSLLVGLLLSSLFI